MPTQLTAPEIEQLATLMIPMFRDALREEWRALRAELGTMLGASEKRFDEKIEELRHRIVDLEKGNRAAERSRFKSVGYFMGLSTAAGILATLADLVLRYFSK